jgi:hypothetical protein
LHADDPKRPTWVRLEGESTSAKSAIQLALHQRVSDYLRDHPNTSGTKVAQGVHASKAEVLHALGDLRQKGLADFETRGQANIWRLIDAEAA